MANSVSDHLRTDDIDAVRTSYEDLVLKIGEIRDLLAEFDEANSGRPTFTF